MAFLKSESSSASGHVPDDRLGEIPVAYLGGDESDTDLEALCRRHLVAYKVPVRFVWMDQLPRNEIGKILRKELATHAGGQE